MKPFREIPSVPEVPLRSFRLVTSSILVWILCSAAAVSAQTSVLQRFVLDDQIDPFFRTLGRDDRFGSALASLGDLNGDGTTELAVGANGDHFDSGAVWIFSLAPNRTISRFVKVGPREGMPEPLAFQARFGSALTALGDVDGDGVGDLAVGAPGDSDGLEPPFVGAGAVWILFMDRNGTVRELVKFSRTRGGFVGKLAAGDQFGAALATPGDLDGNGVPDLLVGAPGDDTGGLSRGALWTVLLERDGSVREARKIATGSGGLPDVLADQEGFGSALARLGDLDGDGRSEVAVGSVRQGGAQTERLRILFLDLNNDVSILNEITPSFGRALASAGDRNADGVPDLAADGAMLLLKSDGTLLQALGGSRRCEAVAAPGDLDGNGQTELVMGFPKADAYLRDVGSIQIAEIDANGNVGSTVFTADGLNLPMPFAPRPASADGYGTAIEPLGDLDEDGEADFAVGAPFDSDRGLGGGAVWVHFIDGPSGARNFKISRTRSGLPLDPNDRFGTALASPGDLNGDGTHDLVVSAPLDDNNGFDKGALYVLFLGSNGRVLRFTKISAGVAGFFPTVAVSLLGTRLEALDDLDGDGHREIMATAFGNRGVVEWFTFFLADDGTVRKATLLDRSRFPLLTTISNGLAFLERTSADSSRRVACLGSGVLQILQLDDEGQIIGLRSRARFGSEIASAGDLDGNGTCDVALLDGRHLEIDFHSPVFDPLGTRLFRITSLSRGLGSLGDVTGDGLPDLAIGIRPQGTLERVVLFSMDGIATVGFEERDALNDELLENGRQIPRPHPGRTFVISSEGSNLGAAIFDSDPLGPNQGNDLTVDSGNVMILQDSLAPTQTTPEIFDHPSDDPDGGLVALDFPRQIRALSLELIDLDPYPNRGAQVHLVDAAGRVRNYVVPAGWTGRFGATHSRKLDLTTLDPQPGAGPYPAIAYQPPGFDPATVVRVEVQLENGGAFDDLLYDPYP